MSKVSFYAWNVTKEAEDLMARMADAICSMLPKDHQIETRVVDVASYGNVDHTDGWGLVFGVKALQHVRFSKNVMTLPSVDNLMPDEKNKDFRAEATNTIVELAKKIKSSEKEEEKTEAHIETKDGITIGKENTDIEIPEKTLVYLKKIKDFLGGGKVVITKGDIRVEVE